MPFISVVTVPDSHHLRIVASEEPIHVAAPLRADGTFADRPQQVVFQREVPETAPLLDDLNAALGSSRVDAGEDTYDCPVTLAIRTIEVSAARRWPPLRIMCPECQRGFSPPYTMIHRMYLACPRCHNPLLNPRWDSG